MGKDSRISILKYKIPRWFKYAITFENHKGFPFRFMILSEDKVHMGKKGLDSTSVNGHMPCVSLPFVLGLLKSGTLVSSLHRLSHLILATNSKEGLIFKIMLYLWKLRLREKLHNDLAELGFMSGLSDGKVGSLHWLALLPSIMVFGKQKCVKA